MNVKEAVQEVRKKLAENNIDTPLLDAQLIVGNAADMTRVQILTYPDKKLNENEICKINEMCSERIKHKPMQYILGVCEFMGLNFNVNSYTLIPRGDTEILVERAIEIVKRNNYNSVLDIGTGSGAIAISMAKYTDADISAVDISEGALKTAIENGRNNGVNVNFFISDLFSKVNEKYDIILSNPPYIEKDVIETLEPDVKDYEPLSALDGGNDGLDFYRRIINEIDSYLNKKGCVIFEIGYNQGDKVSKLLFERGFVNISVEKDLSGLDRVVIGYKI